MHNGTNIQTYTDEEASASYLQMLISTVSEIPGVLFGAFIVDYIGRKNTLSFVLFFFVHRCVSYRLCHTTHAHTLQTHWHTKKYLKKWKALACVLFSLCCFMTNAEFVINNSTMAVVMVSLGRMNSYLIFCSTYIYFTEYYPTSVRTVAIGLYVCF